MWFFHSTLLTVYLLLPLLFLRLLLYLNKNHCSKKLNKPSRHFIPLWVLWISHYSHFVSGSLPLSFNLSKFEDTNSIGMDGWRNQFLGLKFSPKLSTFIHIRCNLLVKSRCGFISPVWMKRQRVFNLSYIIWAFQFNQRKSLHSNVTLVKQILFHFKRV